MEFKSLTNIETSFRQIRLFALVFICLCALVTGFAVWNSYSFAEKQRQKIYVLDNGKSLMLALSQDMAQNRPVEAKSHVRRFHELFFTLSPDKGAIESNIKRSLFLADKTAFNYYKDLAEKGYYNRVISGNVTQTVEPGRLMGHLVVAAMELVGAEFHGFDEVVVRGVHTWYSMPRLAVKRAISTSRMCATSCATN